MPNLYDHSEPGCLFTVLFGILPLVLTYLSFVQEINPSFDVFNMFKVLIWHTVQEFVRVSFENNSFLCFDTLFRWLLSFPSSNLPLPPKKWFENNRKISITKEICITIDTPEKIPERKSDSEAGCIFENFTPKQGNSLKILAAGTHNHLECHYPPPSPREIGYNSSPLMIISVPIPEWIYYRRFRFTKNMLHISWCGTFKLTASLNRRDIAIHSNFV